MRKTICYCDRCGERINHEYPILSDALDIPSYHGGNKTVIKEGIHMDLCEKCYSEITGFREVWDYKRSEL